MRWESSLKQQFFSFSKSFTQIRQETRHGRFTDNHIQKGLSLALAKLHNIRQATASHNDFVAVGNSRVGQSESVSFLEMQNFGTFPLNVFRNSCNLPHFKRQVSLFLKNFHKTLLLYLSNPFFLKGLALMRTFVHNKE